ncbi:beta-glucosidase BglX [Aliagarivorans taiwanensis]|uniref:beta-glucosidase BglX n=1 Tax=Aliagarivorans taiwanensis TaxID=561966 RepID=UPI00040CF48E|nr:beta-glucosidase BglX [Aliagarivorans taiwanensis]
MRDNSFKQIAAYLIAAGVLVSCTHQPRDNRSSSLSLEQQQIETLLSGLTLEQKAGQLSLVAIGGEPSDEDIDLIKRGMVGSIIKANGAANNRYLQELAVEHSSSGIPILFQEDVIHGYKTISPIPLAEAASWDLEAIRLSAEVAAREATAAGIHLTYAPMVDVTRDPRWGRVLETSGEDLYLASVIAAARVEGFQNGSTNSADNLLTCTKHFAGYGAALAGRDYNIQDFSERELREVHLPPFQAAIDAGTPCIMGAYTAYNAVPATANIELMQTILRGEMGFQGLVMTDWETIPNLVKTGVAKDDYDAIEQAMAAGYHIDMASKRYATLLPQLVREGRISEQQLDDAVRQVLRLKQQAGLLDDPYRYFDTQREQQKLLSASNLATVKDVAAKSMVLLKNHQKLLPLDGTLSDIAVIGPLAKAQEDLLGWWSMAGDPDDVVSIYQGLQNALPNTRFHYAPGVTLEGFEKHGAALIPQAVEKVKQADMVIMVLGEERWMSGEGGSTASLHLPGLQEQLLQAIAETNKPIVTVIVAGRPYVLTDIAKHSDALLMAWMPGTTGGDAVAEVHTGAYNPSGKLPITFPIHQGQVPLFYSYRSTSHVFDAGADNNRYTTTFRDVPHEPLYPFGFGLSYSEFSYSDILLSSPTLKRHGSISAQVTVENTSDVPGREVVQLYIRARVSSVTRPVKELKGFILLDLAAGESQVARFEITPQMLEYLGPDLKQRIDNGEYELFIGSSSAELQNSTFSLTD